MVHQDPKVQLEELVKEEHPVLLVLQGHMENPAKEENLDHKVYLESMEHLGPPVNVEVLGLLVHKVFLGHRD